jgi:plastocyanin
MRAKTLQAIVPFVAIAVAAIAVACGGGSGYGGSSNPSPAATSAGAGAGAGGGAASSPTASANASGGAENVVKMVEGQGDPTTAWKFEPAQLTVKVGDTVTFQNTGSQPHTATADDNSFDTGATSAGESKTITFSKAGTFAFHCSFHPWMKGTVTVSGSGASTSGTGGDASAAGAVVPASSPMPDMPGMSGGTSGYGY